MQKQTLLGIDSGGTFTDFVYLDSDSNEWRVHKVLSTPKAPQEALLKGIEDLGLLSSLQAGQIYLVHGTTVATNAALERKGARTAYITNTGLKDVLIIGRQTRAELYSLTPSKAEVPVEVELLFEISARVDASGTVIAEPTETEIAHLEQLIHNAAPEAIAINLLFSYLNPDHEIALERRFKHQYFVSRSSEILPEYKEYERGATTWVNSWLGPRIEKYLNSLAHSLTPASIAIMQSSGLTIAAPLAARKAVNLLLSGPAGGLAAAAYIGEKIQRKQLLTFDMGGTSTDVALINGSIELTNQGNIGGIPIGIPMADIHTIGAGGGSIAYIDEGGLLKVGPQSAGADPGPACYGLGGTLPTVTDANLLLGNLDPETTLADGLMLDMKAANQAIAQLAAALKQTIEETAQGILAIANEHMVQALRVISIQRGHDPREFSLICFGGAGGLHVCDLAQALEITEVVVPLNCGVLSALGMLTTKPGRELVKTSEALLGDLTVRDITRRLDELGDRGEQELRDEGIMSFTRRDSLDLRYEGQTHTLNVPFGERRNQASNDVELAMIAFEDKHLEQFGHQLPRPVELLNCRVHLEADQELPELPRLAATINTTAIQQSHVRRDQLLGSDHGVGPCLILDDHSTIQIAKDWRFRVDEWGNLILSYTQS